MTMANRSRIRRGNMLSRYGLRLMAVALACAFGVAVHAQGAERLSEEELKTLVKFLDAAELAEKVLPKLAEKVEAAAQKPPVTFTESTLTSIRIKSHKLKGLPNIKEVRAYEAGADPEYDYAVQTIKDLSKPIVIGAGKYDVWYETDATDSYLTQLKSGLEIPAGRRAELDFSKLFAAIVTGGKAPANYEIDSSRSMLGKPSNRFSLTAPDKGFPPGTYRFELRQGGRLLHQETFQIANTESSGVPCCGKAPDEK